MRPQVNTPHTHGAKVGVQLYMHMNHTTNMIHENFLVAHQGGDMCKNS